MSDDLTDRSASATTDVRSRVTAALPLIAPLVVLVALTGFVRADPARGVTVSSGAFTDEAWNIINARNFVMFGTWSTDDWNLHLVNVPYSVIQAVVFSVAGIGMAQARLVSIVATVLTMALLAIDLRPRVGRWPAALASIAYGGSTLVLYYGRLAFLEPVVVLFLTAAALLAVRSVLPTAGRWGIAGGVCLALAIGTKPSAAFAALGILAGVLAVGHGSQAARRWLAGALGSLVIAGASWIVLIGLPNRAQVATDLRIWAQEPIFASLRVMQFQVSTFLTRSDGFPVLAAPLLVGGALGLALAVRARRSMSPQLGTLVAVATGWLVFGIGFLALAPYRPNRYFVPMLPALAILVGIAGWALRPGFVRLPRGLRGAVGAVVVVALVAPGAIAYAGWIGAATYDLPAVQAALASAIPAGGVVQGDLAPGFALRAPAVTIVSRPATSINPGDLYQSRGVRWFVGSPGSPPEWAAEHASAWAARTEVLCAPWGGESVCVWQLP